CKREQPARLRSCAASAAGMTRKVAGRTFQCENCPACRARSVTLITTESPSALETDCKGIGLQPPSKPTLCGLMGAAQFLQMMPLVTRENPMAQQTVQASNTVPTLPSGLR